MKTTALWSAWLLSSTCLVSPTFANNGLTDAQNNSPLPNIVYIMTDDQDLELGGLTPMNKTRARIGEAGLL